jgi:hypothetical protein
MSFLCPSSDICFIMNERINSDATYEVLQDALQDALTYEVFQDSNTAILIETSDSIVLSASEFVSSLKSIDVLGVESNTNGRTCNQHACCGHHVGVNDVFYCSWELQTIDDISSSVPFSTPDLSQPNSLQSKRKPVSRVNRKKTTDKRTKSQQSIDLFEDSEDNEDDYFQQDVVKVYKIERERMANCHVGYLPKRLFKKPGAHKFDAIFLRVMADLRISENKSDRARSHRSYGMVTCEVIRDNPRYNGKKPLEGDPCIRSDSTSSETNDFSEISELSNNQQLTKEESVRIARRKKTA